MAMRRRWRGNRFWLEIHQLYSRPKLQGCVWLAGLGVSGEQGPLDIKGDRARRPLFSLPASPLQANRIGMLSPVMVMETRDVLRLRRLRILLS
jgi:hypothetical protein